MRKLSNSRSEASGVEWQLLRHMPRILLVGTLLPILVALAAHASALPDTTLQLLEFFAFGAVILHWTLVLTLSIGCFIVMVMKGPVYEADSYLLPDSERPGN